MTNQYDVAVVGGGLAGLTAAIYAARAGARTILLESAPTLGGRARTAIREGYAFNFGPHALYRAGPAMRVLRELGIKPRGAPPPVKGAKVIRRGRLHAAPSGLFSLVGSSAFDNFGDKIEFISAFTRIMSGRTAAEDHEPLDIALARLTRSSGVREALLSLVRVSSYAHAPAVMSARAAFEQLQLANQGVLYLHGGWTQLVDALEEKARAAGIIIRTSARVSGITPSEDGYRIEIEETALRSTAVILAIAPDEAVQTAPFSDSLRAAAAQLTPVRAACLSVGLRKQSYPDRFFALGQDEPSYYSNHAHVAQGLAPEGGALVHAAFYIAPHEKPPRDVHQRLERLIELVQPEWRSYREAEHFLAMANVTHDLPTAARAGARAPVDIGSGLYIAGDWVGDEGLLSDAAFASGKAAGLIAAEALSLAPQQSVQVSFETG